MLKSVDIFAKTTAGILTMNRFHQDTRCEICMWYKVYLELKWSSQWGEKSVLVSRDQFFLCCVALPHSFYFLALCFIRKLLVY